MTDTRKEFEEWKTKRDIETYAEGQDLLLEVKNRLKEQFKHNWSKFPHTPRTEIITWQLQS